MTITRDQQDDDRNNEDVITTSLDQNDDRNDDIITSRDYDSDDEVTDIVDTQERIEEVMSMATPCQLKVPLRMLIRILTLNSLLLMVVDVNYKEVNHVLPDTLAFISNTFDMLQWN